MAIRSVATGWQVDIRPQGRSGRRLRKTFPRKLDAERWEKEEMAKGLSPQYVAPAKDKRTLSECSQQWFDLRGHKLASGRSRLLSLQFIARALGDPIATRIDKKAFLAYQEQRALDGISKNYLNHELTYLKGVFNTLKKLNEWKLPNPFDGIEREKLDERELSFLSYEEMEKLIAECEESTSDSLRMVVKVCLSTGCRWGEAVSLRGEHIYAGQINFTKTKTRRNRSVPVSSELISELFKGRAKRGRLFASNPETAFENALERARIELPRGQSTHVLRHTFASHFIMSGGDLVTLNKILGHKTLQMTMRYSHLTPDHLIDATQRNPLKLLENHRNGIIKIPAMFFGGHVVDRERRNSANSAAA